MYSFFVVCCASRFIDFLSFFFFFFNDTATTEIYTLSLHDALPISASWTGGTSGGSWGSSSGSPWGGRSEEHTSELQSPCNLVCRLLLEKKKTHCRAGLTSRRARPANRAGPTTSRAPRRHASARSGD